MAWSEWYWSRCRIARWCQYRDRFKFRWCVFVPQFLGHLVKAAALWVASFPVARYVVFTTVLAGRESCGHYPASSCEVREASTRSSHLLESSTRALWHEENVRHFAVNTPISGVILLTFMTTRGFSSLRRGSCGLSLLPS